MKNLLQSLSNMHAEFGATLVDDRKGARSPYVSLQGILEQVTEMTAKHGLKITQNCRVREGYRAEDNTPTFFMTLNTGLHLVGTDEEITSETLLSTTSVTPGMSPDQAWGSSCTYKRRYEIMTILGLFCHGDPTDNDQQDEAPQATTTNTISTAQAKYLYGALKGAGNDAAIKEIGAKYGRFESISPENFKIIKKAYGLE